jgi:tRNA(fMet)-specific endonuclease VapC
MKWIRSRPQLLGPTEIWAELETQGNLIGAHDLWIAATALRHGMDVATANIRDFGQAPGLDVVPV